ERFQVKLDQAGKSWTGRYGEKAVVEEDNEAKLYWGWAFGWDKQKVELKKGPAKLSLMTTTKDPEPRQIDVIVLTTDANYEPRIKDRPKNPTWDVLESYRARSLAGLPPLAKRQQQFTLPDAWKMKTFKDRGFQYLWNMNEDQALKSWLGD